MLDLVQFCSPRPPRGPRKRTRKGVVKDLGTDLCGLLKKKVSFEGHKRERKEPELEPDLELVGPEPIIPDLDDEKEDDFDEPVALKKPRSVKSGVWSSGSVLYGDVSFLWRPIIMYYSGT